MSIAETLRLLRQRRFKIVVFWYARLIVLPMFRLIFGMRIEGLENIPRTGGILMIANHLHNFDPIILYATFIRPPRFMAKKEVFTIPVLGRMCIFFRAFPVDRGAADRAALRQAEQLLAAGKIVAIFPEGTRSVTGGMKEAYPGGAMIAVRSKAPILPVAIFGTETLPMNGEKGRGRLQRPHVGIRIGRPFHLPARTQAGRRPNLSEMTDVMMIEVAKLLPPEYRGIYGDAVMSGNRGGEPALVDLRAEP
jgi:1-acyl-sn-glycerol-3-phosphate acyltransferase